MVRACLMTLGVAIALLWSMSSTAQTGSVNVEVQLLTPDPVAEAILNRKPFFEWIGRLNGQIQRALETDATARDYAITVSVHEKLEPTIKVAVRPPLAQRKLDALTQVLKAVGPQYTKCSSYHVLFAAKTNGGNPDKTLAWSPPLAIPTEAIKGAYTEATMAQKKLMIQRWAKAEALPMLAILANGTDAQFEGVHAVGKMIDDQRYQAEAVNRITNRNPDYWKGMMAMAPGNQLISCSKLMMHVARGEFDYAQRYLFFLRIFSTDNTIASVLFNELTWRLQAFYADVNLVVTKGLDYHNAGNYDAAINIYDQVLDTYPGSAWAIYERFLSEAAILRGKGQGPDRAWYNARPKIYAADPLYALEAKARSGEEGYRMARRNGVATLFKNQARMDKDLIELADIALDLEEWGIAAHLYWLIQTSFKQESYGNRNMVAHYLYALYKMGDTTIVNSFEGNWQPEFQKIEAQRDKLMRESIYYKAFEH